MIGPSEQLETRRERLIERAQGRLLDLVEMGERLALVVAQEGGEEERGRRLDELESLRVEAGLLREVLWGVTLREEWESARRLRPVRVVELHGCHIEIGDGWGLLGHHEFVEEGDEWTLSTDHEHTGWRPLTALPSATYREIVMGWREEGDGWMWVDVLADDDDRTEMLMRRRFKAPPERRPTKPVQGEVTREMLDTYHSREVTAEEMAEMLREVDTKLIRVGEENEALASRVAQAFHEAYERLAPEFGYKTRVESAEPWEEIPEANKRLMIAVVVELLGEGVIHVR